MIMARAYAAHGDEQHFLRTANGAIEIAGGLKDTLDSVADEFSLCDALQEKAQGYTVLWQPEKALEIYKETDRLRPDRPLRDRSSYAIVKAQAHSYVGDLDKGLKYSLEGLRTATQCRSKRYVDRLQTMYNRLKVTNLANDRRVRDIGEALKETHYKQAAW
jgi:tetratricopeptide (TPR) repeat protein